MNYRSTQRGFVALMSAIIIGAVLLGFMASVGIASFFARFDALGIEDKREASALAESCVNVALLALATSTDPTDYSPIDETVIVGIATEDNPMSCTIKDITHSGTTATIDTYASSDDSFQSMSVSVSVSTTASPRIELISWNQSR